MAVTGGGDHDFTIKKAIARNGSPIPRTLPPSSGRRCPEGAEVGFRCGLKKNVRYASPVSSSQAQPRDLFRLPFPFSFVKPSA